VYIRTIKTGGREYHQAVRSFREGKTVRHDVIAHLGNLATPQQALEYWPEEVALLRRTGQHGKADKLERKLNRLKAALEEEEAKRAQR
jgi:hypothetical protein